MNRLLICSIMIIVSLGAKSTEVESKLANGLVVTADYLTAKNSQLSVLIIHGFLSTKNFRTVSKLAEQLREEGYTVLVPTLSLGISRRKISLACEAIHTHSLHEDIDEIQHWINWLSSHEKNNIAVVGHSFGSHEGLIHAYKYKPANVKKIIATSLVDAITPAQWESNREKIKSAKQALALGINPLGEFQVSYCKKYVAPAKSYLSYTDWNKKKLLGALRKINIPIEVVIGESDSRVDHQWIQKLKKYGIKIRIINGANHFFDAQHEFDLLDSILASLKSVK